MSAQSTPNSGDKPQGLFGKIAKSLKKALGKGGQNEPNKEKVSTGAKKEPVSASVEKVEAKKVGSQGKSASVKSVRPEAAPKPEVKAEAPRKAEATSGATKSEAAEAKSALKAAATGASAPAAKQKPAATPAPVAAAAKEDGDYELPGSYGETRITLMVRDPREAVAYWEISEHDRLRHKLVKGRHDKETVLRVHALEADGPLVQARSYGHFDLFFKDSETSSYNLHLDPDRRYVVEVGYLDPLGRFIGLAASEPGETPRSAPAAERASVLAADGTPLTIGQIAAGDGDPAHIEVLKASGYIQDQEEVQHVDSATLIRQSRTIRSPELPAEFSVGDAPSSQSASSASSPGAWQR